MKTIVIISVHEGNTNCYSGQDFRGYVKFNNIKEAQEFAKQHKFVIEETFSDTELGFNLIYLQSYGNNFRRKEIEELFTSGGSEEAMLYWNKQRELRNAKRKAEGFIQCKNIEDMTAEDYKGKLNKALTEEVLKYLKNDVVFGYLGHEFRKLAHDTIIEEVFEEVDVMINNENINQWKLLGIWLTSTDARHFMDLQEKKSVKEFKESIIEYIPEIVLKGYIYGLDEHDGTYLTAIKLKEKYKDIIVINYQGSQLSTTSSL